MDKERIAGIISELLEKKGLRLFEVNYHKKDQTLEVLLDEELGLDELETVSNEISELLDRYEDELPDSYFLDVSNVGAERPIRIGEYIYVKTKENEYYGTLSSYKDGVMNLKVKDKTREKDVSVEYAKTKKARYAVKF